MSASPALPPSGPATVAATSGSAPIPRKKAPVSIFTSTRKKPIKKPVTGAQKAPVVGRSTNDQPPLRAARPLNPGQTTAPAPAPQPTENYQEFSIKIRKTAANEGMRYHVIKFQTKAKASGVAAVINPYDQQQFERPLSLHRRFARDKAEAAEQSDETKAEDNKEMEMMTAKHAARIAEREENQKLIAPSGTEPSKAPHRKKPQKKVEDGRDDTNPVRLKRQQLRYEEARPWHLEDADSKNTWVGAYEQPLSEQSVMFIVSEDGFEMVPVEKWYRFSQSNRVNNMDPEEVERQMNKKFKMPRWAMGTQMANDQARDEASRMKREVLLARKREEQNEDDLFGNTADGGEYQADRDTLDVEYGDLADFQDDDEGELYIDAEGEDGKEIERRIREEMRNAGLGGTGVKDEDLDPEQEYQRELLAKAEEAKKSKKMRKRLKKREHKLEYESDEEEDGIDPYAESSESDDSDEEETERQDDEAKKEEARKAALLNGSKSGASSRGTNTPSGRPEKRDPTRLSATLGKRPGSPDVSDLSGNESSRKKARTANGRAVSTTGPNGARSLPSDPAKLPRVPGGSGSGSDTDTSRAGRPKIRIRNSPPNSPPIGSPNRSRASSPAAVASGSGRAETPKPAGATTAIKKDFPTLDEVRAAIPLGGVEIRALVAQFRTKVAGRTGDFIKLVKAAGQQDKTSGKIMPKADGARA